MKKIFYGWWVVSACFPIALYVSGIVFYGFTALFEPLVEEFSWSYTQISFAASLRGLEAGIFAPVVGFLVDRFGSGKLVLAGTIVVGFGLILLSLTQSLAMFYGSFFLLAFGAGGCMSLVTMSSVAHWFDKNMGKAFGVMSSAFGASGLIVPLLVWLIDVYHWRTALVILGVGMWILGIPLSFVIRNKPEESGSSAYGPLRNGPIPQPEIQHKKVEISFRDVMKNRSFLYLVFVEFIRGMIVSAVIIHVMPYLSGVGISRSTASLVAAGLPLFSIIGRFGFGWLSDIYEKKYVMAVTLCFMGIGQLAFCYMHVKWVAILFLLFFPPGMGGGVVIRGAILRDYFGRDSFGKNLGIAMASSSVGAIIGPTLGGWVFDTQGSYHFAWLACLGLIGLAIVFALKIERIRPQANR